MDNQAQLKKEWIFKTLDRMPKPQRVEASLIQAVFNIQLKEAQALLDEYKRGLNHV